jgi:uncharacterized protein
MVNTKIESFLNEQIQQAEFRAKAYVFDDKNKKRPRRSLYVKINSYIKAFLSGQSANRWLILTGLRGAGKTTLLFQIYHEYSSNDFYKLFLSLDQTRKILNTPLDEVVSSFENLIGKPLEQLEKPLLLFLDEVQYDEKWAIVLKSIYDRTNKVFIFATGSSALQLNINTDIARRAIFEKLFPLNFSEYMKIKNNKFEIKGLSSVVRDALFFSESAKEVFEKIMSLNEQISSYYFGVSKFEISNFINYGSLPFMVATNNESIVYDQINKTLDRVVLGDISATGRLSAEIVNKIPAILYAIADMDAFNISTISNNFGISRPKVMEIFELLVGSEILYRILPVGSHLNQISENKKPSKYIFSSPAFRAMYFKMIGNIISPENSKGKLFEDLVGMYLHRIMSKRPGFSINFDPVSGGADFVFGNEGQKIIMEIGASKKDFRQVIESSKRIKSKYNLVICDDELTLSEEFSSVKVPWKVFLLG